MQRRRVLFVFLASLLLCVIALNSVFILRPLFLLAFPIAKGVFESFFDGTDFDAGSKQFGDIEHTIGARGFRGEMIKLSVVLPIFEFARGFEDALDHADNLMAGDVTGIGDVVDTKRSAP